MDHEDTAAPSGPKLTVTADPGATPSAQMIAAAIQPEVLECEDGRRLHVRKPSPLAQFQIVEAAGPELGINQAWMNMVRPLIYLGQIEDAQGVARPVSMPQTKLQIEGLIVELGEAGLDALLLWYGVNIMAPQMNALEAAERAQAEKVHLKNG